MGRRSRSCGAVGREPCRSDAGSFGSCTAGCGGDGAFGQGGPEPVAVIAFVAEQFVGAWQGGKHQESAVLVAHLSFGDQEHDGPSLAVAHGVELGVQPTFGAPDTSGKSPPFSRLAVVRWALRWVAAIMIRSGSPALPASSAKMRLNTPNRLYRMKRL